MYINDYTESMLTYVALAKFIPLKLCAGKNILLYSSALLGDGWPALIIWKRIDFFSGTILPMKAGGKKGKNFLQVKISSYSVCILWCAYHFTELIFHFLLHPLFLSQFTGQAVHLHFVASLNLLQ